jgi:small conductance mechanosensitive channel
MEDLLVKVQGWVMEFGIKLLVAIVILIIGRWVAKIVRSSVKKLMNKREVDQTLVSFVSNLIYVLLLTFVIIAALGQVGIQTAAFVAILGAAGLAIGFALQGSLSNFAAGILLIMFRPFKAGDFIEAGGAMGAVEAIHIFTTHLKTPDNKAVIIPNSKLMGDNITNFSAKDTRRVDMVFGIGYGDDIRKAKKIIEEVLSKDERVLKDPLPTIGLNELGDSSVNFVVRPWVKTADYWPAKFDITEEMKKQFDANGITIPFPQRDVHLFEHKE